MADAGRGGSARDRASGLVAVDIAPREVPADELQETIRSFRSELATAGETPFMRRDPCRLLLSILADILSVFGRSITRWERAVADVIAARDPLPEEDRIALRAELVTAVEDGAYRGVRKEAQRMVRTIDRRLAGMIGVSIGVAFMAGALSLLVFLSVTHLGTFSPDAERQAAWATLLQNNPDPRPALATAEIRADQTGRRYYQGLSLWLDPARPPPAAR
jgi:hypothetical protein